MKRIVRDRYLTDEEAAKDNLIRKQIKEELPELLARHLEKMTVREAEFNAPALDVESLLGPKINESPCQVELRGCLFVGTGNHSFIAKDFESFELGKRLRIDEDWIAKRLYGFLPPFGGGTVAFAEECRIHATLSLSGGVATLTQVSKCLVRYDAAIYDVSPNS
jgi:hypothetical protein